MLYLQILEQKRNYFIGKKPSGYLGVFYCLWDVGIRDGDLIAVDRAGKRRVGRAVLAVVEGAVTAKILRKRDQKYFLAPANCRESFPDIELTEDSEIWGVIAGIVRKYDLE